MTGYCRCNNGMKFLPDLRGRFYDPIHPEFGPPHAASTGAYLEGLADAAALASALGHRARASHYERAINRGFRSLRQLQFRDHRDAYYVCRKYRVIGGLRTETYDNSIRLDSCAHALAAAIKILHPTEVDFPSPTGVPVSASLSESDRILFLQWKDIDPLPRVGQDIENQVYSRFIRRIFSPVPRLVVEYP